VELCGDAPAQLEALVESLPRYDRKHHAVRLEFASSEVRVSVAPDAGGSWKQFGHVPVVLAGPSLTVTMNREYLLQALRCGMTIIELRDALSPLNFVRRGRTASLVVMPLRLQDTPTTPAEPAPAPPEKPEPITESTRFRPVSTATAAEDTPAGFDGLLRQVEEVRGVLRQALAGLATLGEGLREARRQDRDRTREVESVRGTLRSLQKVRI
jgi:hypothetical protein